MKHIKTAQLTVQRSTDNGKTWYDCKVSDRSLVAAMLKNIAQWDDGCGNTYRRCL